MTTSQNARCAEIQAEIDQLKINNAPNLALINEYQDKFYGAVISGWDCSLSEALAKMRRGAWRSLTYTATEERESGFIGKYSTEIDAYILRTVGAEKWDKYTEAFRVHKNAVAVYQRLDGERNAILKDSLAAFAAQPKKVKEEYMKNLFIPSWERA